MNAEAVMAGVLETWPMTAAAAAKDSSRAMAIALAATATPAIATGPQKVDIKATKASTAGTSKAALVLATMSSGAAITPMIAAGCDRMRTPAAAASRLATAPATKDHGVFT